jgi:lipoprotein-releasing system ATP-binding protein
MSSARKAQPGPAVSPAGPLLSVRELRKTYRMGKVDLEVLRGLDLDVAAGEFVAIYGHSGSGKSTLLHLLGLLDRPTHGRVFLEGSDTTRFGARRRNRVRCTQVGFIFQFYHLLPELTVLENTLLPAMVERSAPGWFSARQAARKRAADLLDELGLADRLGHKPKELSGGEQQRVAIARALVNHPRLLLADEPTGNLDSKTGRKILDVLHRFHREHNQTILMVTHDRDLARDVSRSVTLQDGRMVDAS